MDKVKLLEAIIELLGNDHDGAVGLRAEDTLHEVGSSLKPSRVWEDGIVTDEVLDGTCAIVISHDWQYNSVEEIEANIEKYCDGIEAYGKYIYVIAGDLAQAGEDIGEIIIPNAKIIMEVTK